MANLSIRPIPLLIGPMQTFKFTYMLNFQDLTIHHDAYDT
jgi:hypothetical protein